MDSLEELDAIMAEFPFGPFSDTEIVPIVDLVPALQRANRSWKRRWREAAKVVTKSVDSLSSGGIRRQ